MFTRVFQAPTLSIRLLVPCLLAVFSLLTPAVLAQTDEDAQESSAPATKSAQLVELNRGIRAFIEGRQEIAKTAFEGVLTKDPGNAGCLYYLGLIYMGEGLQLSSSQDPDIKQSAQSKFDQARDYLERVINSTDPTVMPVEAGLMLGIAQLAVDTMQDPDLVLKLAQTAHDTLKRNDRFFRFRLNRCNA